MLKPLCCVFVRHSQYQKYLSDNSFKISAYLCFNDTFLSVGQYDSMTGSEITHLRQENAQLRKENQFLRQENERLVAELERLGHPQKFSPRDLEPDDRISQSVEPPFPVVRKFPPKESIDIKPPVNDIAPNTKRRSWANGKIVYDFEQAHDFDPPKPHPKLQAAAGKAGATAPKPKRKFVAKSSLNQDAKPPPPKQTRKPPAPKPPVSKFAKAPPVPKKAKSTPLRKAPPAPKKAVAPPKKVLSNSKIRPIPNLASNNDLSNSSDFEEGAFEEGWKSLPSTFSKFSVDSTDSFHKIDIYGRAGDGSTDSGLGVVPPIPNQASPPSSQKPPPKPQSMVSKRPPPSKPATRNSMPPIRSKPKPKKAPPPSPNPPPKPKVATRSMISKKTPPPLKKKAFSPPPPRKSGNVQNKISSPATSTKYFSVEQLKEKSIAGLDYKNTEIYLSPADFQAVFGMNIDEFSTLKIWKKKQIKQKLGLW